MFVQLHLRLPVHAGIEQFARGLLAAAAARVNVATANLYPQISLGGSLGSTAQDSGELGDDQNFRFSFGPLISWSFPNVFAARAQIKAADARSDAALATFDQTVLTALQETETALSNYANELDRRAALQAELARVEAALGAADNANGPDEAGPAAP